MGVSFQKLPSGLWSPQRTAFVAGNLASSFEQATPSEHMLGQQFYPDWNNDAHYLADRLGTSTAHTSALMARLSPGTEAELNRMMAYQLADLDQGTADRIRAAAGLVRQAASAPPGSGARAALQAQAQDVRKSAGLRGTPLDLQTSANIGMALDHRDGVYDDPLSTLGQVKINDFGHAINDPLYHRQIIDTHFHDAAIGRTDLPYASSRGLSSVGRYENFQRAAEVARHKVAPQTPPTAFMGAVWYHQQQRKVSANPDAAKARSASESRLSHFRGGAWDPAVHGQRPTYTHIKY